MFLIDPYNLFNVSGIIGDNIKLKMINRSNESSPRGNILWKLIEYKHKPCSNLIIGDSHAFSINDKLVKEISGNKFYNFGIPGADTETKFNIFWFAVSQASLNHVIIQLSFLNWETNDDGNLYRFAKENIQKPYLCLFNSAVLGDSYQNIKYVITHKYEPNKYISKFPITIDLNKEFNSSLKRLYNNYKYSDKNTNELKKIVNYCKKNNVIIEFVLFPLHQKYYDYLLKNDLMQFHIKFIADISQLGKTYNFSNNRTLNSNEKNFVDYYHPNQHITDSLTYLIWGKSNLNSKLK
jgi:hypothetical protein